MKLSRVTGATWKYANPTLPPRYPVWVEDSNHGINQPVDLRLEPTLSCVELNDTSWYDQPRVWQNFVTQTLPDFRPNYDECWRILDEELAKWGLSMPDRNLVCGTPEHMLMWRLAYE